MRQRKVLTIWRDDHIGDVVGGIFLDDEGQGADAVFDRLRDYLGSKVKILKVELMRDRLTAEVDSLGLPEESSRLAAAALDLRLKGARRNAEPLFREALELDPLNADATVGLGMLLIELQRYDAALKTLRRAREIAGDEADLLRALGEACVHLERFPSAVAYFQRALELRPNDPLSRRALIALGRKPAPLAEAPPGPEPRRIRLVRKRQKQ
jgi:tetratricopeptide (TPR) repeat protein